MDEIIFRGKNIKTGEWIKSYSIRNSVDNNWENLKGRVYLLDGILNPKWTEVIPETVGQYTELKDKNGTEIYAKDIVKYGNCLYTVEYGQWFDEFHREYFGWHLKLHIICGTYSLEEQPCQMFYAYGDYLVVFPYDKNQTDQANENLKVEVIGNIFENPELLKGEK
jgi:uncharacterized phage protein (TIGR01671 family)